jgi:hypothetical protein
VYKVTTEDRQREEGYAWGMRGHSGQWLTIPGSARRAAPLTVRPEDAPRPGFTTVAGGEPVSYFLAKVERVSGTAFRVLDLVDAYTPERGDA